jgi:hypothetical protein
VREKRSDEEDRKPPRPQYPHVQSWMDSWCTLAPRERQLRERRVGESTPSVVYRMPQAAHGTQHTACGIRLTVCGIWLTAHTTGPSLCRGRDRQTADARRRRPQARRPIPIARRPACQILPFPEIYVYAGVDRDTSPPRGYTVHGGVLPCRVPCAWCVGLSGQIRKDMDKRISTYGGAGGQGQGHDSNGDKQLKGWVCMHFSCASSWLPEPSFLTASSSVRSLARRSPLASGP